MNYPEGKIMLLDTYAAAPNIVDARTQESMSRLNLQGLLTGGEQDCTHSAALFEKER